MTIPKTPQEVREEFANAGISVSQWARENGFDRFTVYGVLRGRYLGARGKTHEIAVALGLKAGSIVAVSEFKPKSAVTAKKAA